MESWFIYLYLSIYKSFWHQYIMLYNNLSLLRQLHVFPSHIYVDDAIHIWNLFILFFIFFVNACVRYASSVLSFLLHHGWSMYVLGRVGCLGFGAWGIVKRSKAMNVLVLINLLHLPATPRASWHSCWNMANFVKISFS